MKSLRTTVAALLGMLPLIATSASTTNDSSRIELNKEIIRRYFGDVWNRGNLDELDQLLDANYINHTPSTPDPPPGPAGLKPIVRALRSAFPDLHFEIKDIVATEDSVVARVVMTGTHRGDLFGLPPTGRRIEVNQINIEHIRDGRIAEHWRVTDELTLMKQLGFVQ
jgi:steroid delta-isomerase-like uncharacterized protein